MPKIHSCSTVPGGKGEFRPTERRTQYGHELQCSICGESIYDDGIAFERVPECLVTNNCTGTLRLHVLQGTITCSAGCKLIYPPQGVKEIPIIRDRPLQVGLGL